MLGIRAEMLSNSDIANELGKKGISIIPFDNANLQPASYDLTFGEGLDTRLKVDQLTHKIVASIAPGEAAMILTAERVYLGDHISGHVNLINHLALRGLLLVNPGHIDPGWGKDKNGNVVGFQLTAIVRNISNEKVELSIGDPLLTLTLDYLLNPTSKSYWTLKPPDDPLARKMALSLEAQRIAKFVEVQRNLEKDVAKLWTKLETKVSWSELVRSLAWLITGLGLIITLTAAIVTTATRVSVITVGAFNISVPAFLIATSLSLGVFFVIGFFASIRRKNAKES